MSTAPLLVVDTGADGVLLNLALAKFMGFRDAHLATEECKGANGVMTVHTPKDLAGTEIEIDGHWYQLPSLNSARRSRCWAAICQTRRAAARSVGTTDPRLF